MTAPAKFLFEQDFGSGTSFRRGDSSITLAEHARKLAEAEADGQRGAMAAAEAKAGANTERRTAVALEHVADALGRLASSLHAVEARLETEAVEVAVAVAKKLAPELIAREPFAEIAALATECFRQLVSAPHVVVRVSDTIYALTREKLEEVCRMSGLAGRLVVLAEPDIAPGDCRIEWADGGLTRDRAAIEAAIGEAVGRYVSARLAAAGGDEADRRSER